MSNDLKKLEEDMTNHHHLSIDNSVNLLISNLNFQEYQSKPYCHELLVRRKECTCKNCSLMQIEDLKLINNFQDVVEKLKYISDNFEDYYFFSECLHETKKIRGNYEISIAQLLYFWFPGLTSEEAYNLTRNILANNSIEKLESFIYQNITIYDFVSSLLQLNIS